MRDESVSNKLAAVERRSSTAIWWTQKSLVHCDGDFVVAVESSIVVGHPLVRSTTGQSADVRQAIADGRVDPRPLFDVLP